eukprot:SAG11_NODE_1152_length_5663_cov_110.803379_4_plen_213_part_00
MDWWLVGWCWSVGGLVWACVGAHRVCVGGYVDACARPSADKGTLLPDKSWSRCHTAPLPRCVTCGSGGIGRWSVLALRAAHCLSYYAPHGVATPDRFQRREHTRSAWHCGSRVRDQAIGTRTMEAAVSQLSIPLHHLFACAYCACVRFRLQITRRHRASWVRRITLGCKFLIRSLYHLTSFSLQFHFRCSPCERNGKNDSSVESFAKPTKTT